MSAAANPPSRPRVLVAGTQEVIDAAHAVFGGALQLTSAYSVAEALRQVEKGVDLVLCNVRFDDSRMFDFLGALNAMPPARQVPVICCRMLRTPMSAGSRRGIELALEALGVVAFVDMHDLEQKYGAPAAQAALRDAVMRHLGAGAA
jgi:response regulator RpfG family c-di-GMP phosphodiesterase